MGNPTHYGRYEIIKKIGRGSMGIVYHAHDPHIDRPVALKVLRSDRVTSPDFVRRFLREAKVIGRLNHRNIVNVYDMGEDHGTVFLAMEYIQGVSLERYLVTHPVSLPRIFPMFIQIAEALDYAHSRGITHRDIKPSNILIQEDGTPKITDFGIARLEDPHAVQHTQAGEILGTPAYMSPEQVLGKPVDGRSDIYSLGVMLYEAACGQRPFSGKALATILTAIVQETPPAPSTLAPDIHPELARIITRCLAKNPEERFQSCRQLAHALKRLEEKLTKPEKEDVSSGLPSESRVRRPWLVVVAMLIVALAVLSVLVIRSSRVATVRVDFTSSPSEALVLVDEKEIGRTPLQSTLTKGPHRIRMSKDGFEPWEDEISIHASQRTVTAELQPQRIPVTIHSEPQGADVLVDGTPSGTTPIEVMLTKGAHRVHLSLNGYHPKDVELTADADLKSPVKAVLDPLTGRLRIYSTPPGADVFVDGRPLGITPFQLSLPVGEHEIRLERQGHEPWKGRLVIAAGEDHQINATMGIPSASLNIVSSPLGAQVFMDDRLLGNTPLRVDVGLGPHLLRLSLDGYQPWEETIDFNAPRAYTIRKELAPHLLPLRVLSSPENATVQVDGKERGTTPLTLSLPPGKYAMRIRKPGFHPWEGTVRVREGVSTPLKVRLPPVMVYLSIDSEPTGAVLHIDDAPVAKTPARQHLAVGEHTLRLSMKGYEDWQEKIQIPKNSEENAIIDMGRVQLRRPHGR